MSSELNAKLRMRKNVDFFGSKKDSRTTTKLHITIVTLKSSVLECSKPSLSSYLLNKRATVVSVSITVTVYSAAKQTPIVLIKIIATTAMWFHSISNNLIQLNTRR